MEMTNQEAIKVLTDKHTSVSTSICDDVAWRKLQPAIDVAVAALEKQIPKKPNNYAEISGSDGSAFEGDCPSCGAILCSEFDFCTDCGQAIDWRE